MGSSQTDKAIQSFLNVNDKMTFSQLSLSPVISHKVYQTDKFYFSVFGGLRLDYILSVPSFSTTSYTTDLYKKRLSKLNLGMTAGLGAEYALTDKIGLITNLSYNQHITRMSNARYVFHLTTNGQNNQNYNSYVNFLQMTFGVTYKLKHKTTAL